MRFTVCRAVWRRSCTPPWRTLRSTLLQARGKWRRPIICRCRALRLSVQRREPVSFLRRCATVSAWCCVWELYEPKELAKIVTRSAGILGIDIEADGALEIASRSRGTPRIANRMLKRVRDFAQIMSDGVITYSTAKIALDRLEIDELGLDSGDRRMLNAIIQYYNGGPVGVETLAAAHWRGSRDDRRRCGAVSDADRLFAAYPARPLCHTRGLLAPRTYAAGNRCGR